LNITPSYNSIARTATVAAVFSAVVGIVLVVGFLNWRTGLPLDEPQYLALKKQLAASGDRPAVQQQLREVDVQLRQKYFRQQALVGRGAYLLAGGVAASVLLWQWAFTVRRRMPQPRTAPVSDRQVRQNRQAQWACVAVVVALASIICGWVVSSPSVLAGRFDELEFDADARQLPSESPPTLAPVHGKPLPTAEQLAANWHRFRGLHGAGISAFTDVPQRWNGATGEGVLWKSAIPLPGASSPIVWEKRVFLTGANEEQREVYCFDADAGKLLWQRPVDASGGAAGELRIDSAFGFAASTPTTDGQRVYAMFANGDVAAFDFVGQEVWSFSLGVPDNSYGHATSLAIWKDLLIIQMDQGSEGKSRLLAIRGSTGETVWQIEREVAATWSTPIVVEFEEEARIITCADPWVITYAPEDGSEFWRAKCLSGDVAPSPVYADGVVYVANDLAVVAAIRDGGQGDVTESHILWSADVGLPDISSPLVADQYLLLVASYGELVCYDRQQGGEEPLWEEFLDDTVFASPSLVAGNVYLMGEQGKGWVVRAGAAGVEQIAENDLGEPCVSSPAFQPGRIYLRGKDHLFCVGQE
jgi:outer membrane protein assembly factor BamB